MTMFVQAVTLLIGVLTSHISTVTAWPPPVNDKQALNLPALGRTARLGSLYDAQTDTFTGISILNKNIPLTLKTVTGTPSTSTKMGVTHSYEDKNELLQISASMSLKALAGLVSISGSGRYLEDSAKRSNNVIGAFLYQTLTSEEMLEIFYDEMKTYISPTILEAATETHVLVGIRWGANVIVKFEDMNEDQNSITDISSKMEMSLGYFMSGNAHVHSGKEQTNRMANYTIQIFGDISFEGKDYPKNISEVMNFVQKIPNLVNMSNEGKGKELSFYLLPIKRVRDSMSIKNKTDTPYFDLTPELASPYVQMFEEYSRVGLKLNDLYSKMMNYRDVLFNEDLARIQKLQRGFINSTLVFKAAMKEYLLLYSAGNKTHTLHANKIQSHFHSEDFSPASTEKLIDSNFKNQLLKIKVVELTKSYGVTWIGRSESLDIAKVDLYQKHGIQTNFLVTNYYVEHLQNVKDFLGFLDKCHSKDNCCGIVVDCDFIDLHSHCNQSDYKLTNGIDNSINSQDNSDYQLSVIQREHLKLKKHFKQLSVDVNKLKDTERVPIGFVYTQLPYTPSPKELWPGLTWTDISNNFGGHFFRVANGSSVSFPKLYGSKGIRLTNVEESDRGGGDNVKVNANEWSDWLYTGNSAGNGRAIRFFVSGNEQVPPAASVLVWRRTA